MSAGGSWGSRMTFLAGNALADACDKLKKAMAEAKTKTYAGMKKAGKPTRYEGNFAADGPDKFDPKTGQGLTTRRSATTSSSARSRSTPRPARHGS